MPKKPMSPEQATRALQRVILGVSKGDFPTLAYRRYGVPEHALPREKQKWDADWERARRILHAVGKSVGKSDEEINAAPPQATTPLIELRHQSSQSTFRVHYASIPGQAMQEVYFPSIEEYAKALAERHKLKLLVNETEAAADFHFSTE